jgi:hypothetical protein
MDTLILVWNTQANVGVLTRWLDLQQMWMPQSALSHAMVPQMSGVVEMMSWMSTIAEPELQYCQLRASLVQLCPLRPRLYPVPASLALPYRLQPAQLLGSYSQLILRILELFRTCGYFPIFPCERD